MNTYLFQVVVLMVVVVVVVDGALNFLHFFWTTLYIQINTEGQTDIHTHMYTQTYKHYNHSETDIPCTKTDRQTIVLNVQSVR